MKIFLIIFISLVCFAKIAAQTIRVNPTGVNVNSQNATTVYLTFGQIPAGYIPAEAIWCGELIPATLPALGLQCRPDTIYGALPERYNRAQPSGNAGLTDIMAIPPSVVRRAYQAAVRGASAGFFYVRRFVSTAGQPDQFVNVTCRMTGGGARVPFALTNVEIRTPDREPILFIKTGAAFPPVTAEIQYNGTGRLKGRWELVLPGEEPPRAEDLLTEATLPPEQRGTQRRYAQIARFNHFLPPIGKFVLALENIDHLPFQAEGQYILLLRIEATDDKESDSDLTALGVGNKVVHSGAVAAFPLPVLKFFVSGKTEKSGLQTNMLIAEKVIVEINQPIVFNWKETTSAAVYHLEVLDAGEKVMLSALLPASILNYRAPSWFREKFGKMNLTWRIAALDENGTNIRVSEKQILVFR